MKSFDHHLESSTTTAGQDATPEIVPETATPPVETAVAASPSIVPATGGGAQGTAHSVSVATPSPTVSPAVASGAPQGATNVNTSTTTAPFFYSVQIVRVSKSPVYFRRDSE